MKRRAHPDTENDITQLILSVFRVNGALLAAGDRLTASIGLTSARWQVLGTVATTPTPLTVAGLAKSLGSSRQNVRVIVRELEAAGMVRLAENPNHQRASLVTMTPKGKTASEATRELQAPFAKKLSKGLNPQRMKDCVDLLQTLHARLEAQTKMPNSSQKATS